MLKHRFDSVDVVVYNSYRDNKKPSNYSYSNSYSLETEVQYLLNENEDIKTRIARGELRHRKLVIRFCLATSGLVVGNLSLLALHFLIS